MQGNLFDPEQLKTFLLANGYTKEDVEANFPTYVENFFSNLIIYVLNQFPPEKSKEIIGTSNLDTDAGCLEVLKRMNESISNKTFSIPPLTKEQVLSFIKQS